MTAPGATVLIADDEEPILRLLSAQIDNLARVLPAPSGEAAWEILRRADVDLVVTDVRMPGLDGLEFLRRVKEWDPDLPVVVVTAFGSIEEAVGAMRAGAFDYLTKPVEMAAFRQAVERALAVRRLREENRYLRERLGEADLPDLVGTSAAMLEVKRRVREAAATDAPVLLTGESGTGKGVVARVLHALSGRKGPFVRVNCAALPEALLESELFGHVRGAFTGAHRPRKGKFLLADEGTLFLDEIGTMPVLLQAKILHALEEGVFAPVGADEPVRTSARIVAATNARLDRAVEEGRFRADLYWRLHVIGIALPSLADRREDIPLLVHYLLGRLAPDRTVEPAPETMAALVARPWPGNIRELENALRRALARAPRADRLGPETLDEPLPPGADEAPLKEALARTERALLLEALRRTGGRKAAAADLLGISPRMLSYYLEKYPDLEAILAAER